MGIGSPIWSIEGVALNSTGDLVADSLADVVQDIQASVGGGDIATSHLPLFGGSIYYVDAAQADDTGAGTSPETAKKTLLAGIALMSVGDALNVKAGTYTDVGLDLSVDATELWCEIGVVIDPATGTALTLSGDYCRIKGNHTITPGAGETGILISGANCIVSNSKILAGAIGVQITGSGAILNECASGFQTSIAYDMQGIQGRMYRCKTVGNAATTGYKISGGADTGVLEQCTSAGHQTAGYYIDTGSQDWTLLRCSSGAGDGRWVDVDRANVWSGFTFDDHLSVTQTFNASGPTSTNLFRVYGTVLITAFYGHVETVLDGDIGNGYIELDDGTNQLDVTDSPGPSFNTVPVESYIHKIDDATVQIKIENSSQVRLYEDSTKFGRDPNFQIIAKTGAATYIRFTYSGAGTSGAIHWHCQWEPLTDEGFMVTV